jgi:hypothetical protein
MFICAGWEPYGVHAMRSILAKVRKGNAEMVAAAIRTNFAQATADAVYAHRTSRCHAEAPRSLTRARIHVGRRYFSTTRRGGIATLGPRGHAHNVTINTRSTTGFLTA